MPTSEKAQAFDLHRIAHHIDGRLAARSEPGAEWHLFGDPSSSWATPRDLASGGFYPGPAPSDLEAVNGPATVDGLEGVRIAHHPQGWLAIRTGRDTEPVPWRTLGQPHVRYQGSQELVDAGYKIGPSDADVTAMFTVVSTRAMRVVESVFMEKPGSLPPAVVERMAGAVDAYFQQPHVAVEKTVGEHGDVMRAIQHSVLGTDSLEAVAARVEEAERTLTAWVRAEAAIGTSEAAIAARSGLARDTVRKRLGK